MIKPHDYLEYVRPDEIAECWDNVSDQLYKDLYALEVHYCKPPNGEYHEFPEFGRDNVIGFWDYISDDNKAILNVMAAKQDPSTEGQRVAGF